MACQIGHLPWTRTPGSKPDRTRPWTRTPGSKPDRTCPWTRTPGSAANRTRPWTRTLGSKPDRALPWTRTLGSKANRTRRSSALKLDSGLGSDSVCLLVQRGQTYDNAEETEMVLVLMGGQSGPRRRGKRSVPGRSGAVRLRPQHLDHTLLTSFSLTHPSLSPLSFYVGCYASAPPGGVKCAGGTSRRVPLHQREAATCDPAHCWPGAGRLPWSCPGAGPQHCS
jgi:hypothetical protein